MLALAAAALGGCGSDAERRPDAGLPRGGDIVAVGVGPRFHPPSLSAAAARGAPIHGLTCATRERGRRFGVHVEVFAERQVLIVPAGIGVAPPRLEDAPYVRAGRCSYAARTREPTGVLEIAPGRPLTLGDAFAIWGQPLSRDALTGFTGPVEAFVGGRPWRGDPAAIPLRRHAQIVLEVGPHVPPHARYRFPPGL